MFYSPTLTRLDFWLISDLKSVNKKIYFWFARNCIDSSETRKILAHFERHGEQTNGNSSIDFEGDDTISVFINPSISYIHEGKLIFSPQYSRKTRWNYHLSLHFLLRIPERLIYIETCVKEFLFQAKIKL